MNGSLTARNVLRAMASQLEKDLQRQITDASHPDLGALVNPDWGIPSPTDGITPIARCGFLHLAGETAGLSSSHWLERGALAMEHLLRTQRPSGRMDLLSTNYDCGPAAAFAVQRLCPLVELGRQRASEDPAWASFLAKVETFIRRAVPGIMTGGFHTPNHRWIVASALAYAAKLFPDLRVRSVVDAYLAEGFDIDADGAFIERSAGTYDSACDRSLLLLDQCMGAAGALAAACANLERNLYLLHDDGTIETGLSHRQDFGHRSVPLTLAGPYLMAAHLASDARFAAAAGLFWEKASSPHEDHLNWLYYALARFGEFAATEHAEGLPTDYVRLFPVNGFLRARCGPLSATLFRDSTRLLTLVYGQAELSSLKISQAYFGVGRFVGEELSLDEGRVVLRSSGQQRLHRPGYDHPLGRPVPPEQWASAIPQREWRPLPPCTSTLEVEPMPDGLRCHYRTVDGLDGVTAQLALDFAPGGVWETGDTCVSTHAGQVIFLKRGCGAMRYGADVIRIGPGADAHRMWAMRNAEPAPDHVRVLMTFRTPVDHAFAITCQRQAAVI